MSDRTRVAVLGSTGSIGRQSLDVIAAHPDRFEVVALAAGRDVTTLNEQIARHQPRTVAVADESVTRALELGSARLLGGQQALEEMAADEAVDLVLVGTTGVVSLKPVIAALEQGKVVATANKETLVAGGHLVMPLAKRMAEAAAPGSMALAYLRPIDSEHSAIWQCLAGERRSDISRLIITGSGGPFRTWNAERIAVATPEDALAHPTWRMGAKVTIDSATLMNKALEVIEACWLYDVADDQVDVVVHPQSIVHSMVEFADGSLKAQLGLPDMRIPIQYALTFPEHLPSPAPRLAPTTIPNLGFEPVDEGRFPALQVGRDAGRRGSRASAALIAADDVAVERFLGGTLGFNGIADLCAHAVDRFGNGADPNLEELITLDAHVRRWAETATLTGASTH
ncbi:MAG TPA: 1-deoxy-D-xylulose-5-phosphate reductoisomerase [Candidatus Limnocylindrales bacterium]|nr:1-deoxy-D-xylulose-5-phosphate reductoisomerase [Candidatus Limnocylindrales bacterium]